MEQGEVLAPWIETANTALLETQRSDKYLVTPPAHES